MPIADTLSPEDAKLEKQRLKEEKKNLKMNGKPSARKRKPGRRNLPVRRQALWRMRKPTAVLYLW